MQGPGYIHNKKKRSENKEKRAEMMLFMCSLLRSNILFKDLRGVFCDCWERKHVHVIELS